MIVGTGLDIVEIERIEKIYAQYGNAFAKRILCEGEYRDYEKQKANNLLIMELLTNSK